MAHLLDIEIYVESIFGIDQTVSHSDDTFLTTFGRRDLSRYIFEMFSEFLQILTNIRIHRIPFTRVHYTPCFSREKGKPQLGSPLRNYLLTIVMRSSLGICT